MAPDRMQAQRFELKYIIHNDTALRIRDFVHGYLDLDEYSAGQPNLSYAVHSLYLDSDDLRLYWDVINGNRNRFKLRLRYYSTDPSSPVFFEIKRRYDNCIAKQRGAVRQDAVEDLLRGYLPGPEHLVSYNPKNPKGLIALQRFCHLMSEIQATPKVHIAYYREAYANNEGTVRLTLDREVRAEPNFHFAIKTEMQNPKYSFIPYVILELKFTDRFPEWFRTLVETFGVMQRGAAKYCASVQAVADRALRSVYPIVKEEEVNAFD